MTDNEKNLAICQQIEQIALSTWEKMKTKMEEGTYTAIEVAQENCRYGNLEMEMATVEVDNFRCEFPICESFRLLHTFYGECRTDRKKRVRFTYMQQKEEVASATVTIEKQHSIMAKMVADDALRPVMESIYLDMEHGLMAASDGHILAAMHVQFTAKEEEQKRNYMFLPAAAVKNKDTYTVTAYEDGTHHLDGTTQQLAHTTEPGWRYPDYMRVISEFKLSTKRHFAVTKEGVKQLTKFLKSLKRLQTNGSRYEGAAHKVEFYFEAGESVMHVRYQYDEYNVERACNKTMQQSCDIPLEQSYDRPLLITLGAEYMLMFMSVWNGHFWYLDPSYRVIFDTDTRDTILLMPCYMEDSDIHIKIYNWKDEPTTTWDNRYTYLGTQETINPNNQSTNQFTFMEFYTLDRLASGYFEVRGEDNKLACRNIQAMAAHMQRDAKLFRKVQETLNAKFGTGEQARKLFPLPMHKLYTAIKEALEQCGADVNAILAPQEKQEEAKPVAKPEPKPVPEPQPQTEPDPDPQPEQKPNDITITRTSEVVGGKFYPLLIVATEGETFRVAGNSMYNAIASGDGTITEENQLLFDSIDAFITDGLITQDLLDEEAIFNEMAEFFQMVEEASQFAI